MFVWKVENKQKEAGIGPFEKQSLKVDMQNEAKCFHLKQRF